MLYCNDFFYSFEIMIRVDCRSLPGSFHDGGRNFYFFSHFDLYLSV
jgi:hypothetical protein